LVKDRPTQERALAELAAFAADELPDCAVAGSIESPILGGDGQREFLLALAHAAAQTAPLDGPFYDGSGAPNDAAPTAAPAPSAPAPAASGAAAAVAAAAAAHEAIAAGASALEPVRVTRPKTAAARRAANAAKRSKERSGNKQQPEAD
jgi:hypothetical protein